MSINKHESPGAQATCIVAYFNSVGYSVTVAFVVVFNISILFLTDSNFITIPNLVNN